MDTMTYMTTTLRSQHFGQRLWLRLRTRSRRRATAADLDTLSDHMLRDIGIERDRIDQMAIKTLHDAMRYSG
jgi:uncharacterized protein YjiS (DUF1127 family)